MANWTTRAEILFNTNGKEILGSLIKQVGDLTKKLEALTPKLDATSLAFNTLAASATKAAAAIEHLNAVMNGSMAAASGVASRATRQAGAYRTVADAANAASVAVLRLNAAQSFPAITSARRLALGPATGQNWARYTPNFAFGAAAGTALATIPYQPSGYRAPSGGGPLPLGRGYSSGAANLAASAFGMGGGGGMMGGGGGAGGGGGFAIPGGGGRGQGVTWAAAARRGRPLSFWGGMGLRAAGAYNIAGNFIKGINADVPKLPGLPTYWAHHLESAAILGTAGFAWDSLSDAAKLQLINQTTANITGATPYQMQKLRQQEFDVGAQTAMTPVETADMFREFARQSQGAPGMTFNTMRGILPYMAKLQMVMGVARNFSPMQTTDATMGIMHLLRQYDPKKMPQMFDQILRMSELMPTNLTGALRQMTYFVPTFKSLGVSDSDAMTMMVVASRFGMGANKGGTSLANLASGALPLLQMTAHVQKGKAALMKEMGLIDDKGQSRFFFNNQGLKPGDKGYRAGDMFGFLDAIAKFSDKVGSLKAYQDIISVFGKVGGRIGTMFSDDVLIKLAEATESAMKTQASLGLGHQAGTLYDTAGIQSKQAWANFQALATEVGTIALPGMTKGMHDLADSFHNAQHWLNQHKELTKAISAWIKDSISETEKWIKGHHKEFHDYAMDLKEIGENLSTWGPAVKLFADNIITLGLAFADAARDITKAINWVGKAFHPGGAGAGDEYGMTPDGQVFVLPKTSSSGRTGSGTVLPTTHATRDLRNKLYGPGGHAMAPSYNPPADPFALPGVKKTSFMSSQPQTTVGTININISGSGDPKAVAQAVLVALNDMTNSPRSTLAQNALYRPHPRIPLPLSVSPAGTIIS